MGKDIIEKGYIKVYSKHASVFHSHNYSLMQFFQRYFDEYRGLKISLGYTENFNTINEHI